MGHHEVELTQDPAKAQPAEGSLDKVRRRAQQRKLATDQNPVLATLAGAVAAGAGAAIWGGITELTNTKIGLVAMALGFLVAYAVRFAGKGVTPLFGYIAASMTLLGCLTGNILAACLFLAKQERVPLTDVLARLDPELVRELLTSTFSPIDLFSYAVALYVAYRFSFDPV